MFRMNCAALLLLAVGSTACARPAIEWQDAGGTEPTPDSGATNGDGDQQDAAPTPTPEASTPDPVDAGTRNDSGNGEPPGDGDGADGDPDPDAGESGNPAECPDAKPMIGAACSLNDVATLCRYGGDDTCTCTALFWACF